MQALSRWRDRWLGTASVRSAIGRLPIGRRIADRHARRLFGTVAGFVASQMLAAGVELGVFTLLHEAARERGQWPALFDLSPDAAAALIQALIATGLVEERPGGRVGLTIDGLVVATDPGLRAMIAHNRRLYADLADPVAMLRGGGPGEVARFWPYAGGGGAPDDYAALMAVSQELVADALFADMDFGGARHVMDIGGGDGRFLATLAERYAAPKLTLVDLPAVVPTARRSLRRQGLEKRIEVVAADPGAPLPGGADMITMIRTLHDQSDSAAGALIAAAARAVMPGGRVIVAEPMARAGRDPQTAYFAAYFAAMRSGRLRTAGEIRTMLRQAGLVPGRRARNPSLLLGIVGAAK